MAKIVPNLQNALSSEPRSNWQAGDAKITPANTIAVPRPPSGMRSGHLNLDTFSPVNQNGSFAFDRVLKSGEVHKRTRKTKVRRPDWATQKQVLLILIAFI